jgi:hypothetical protein
MKNIGNIVKYLAIATVVMVSTLSSQDSAVAGSGYYDYGVHGGYMQLMGDDLDFTDESSGASFGFKRGMYFIKDGLAAAIDYVGFTMTILGSGDDSWIFNLPVSGLGLGTGAGPFMFYVGGEMAFMGMDTLEGDVTLSLFNPSALGGIQVAMGDYLLLRAQYQMGYTVRVNADNYLYNNTSLMLGYGFYSPFL